MMIGQLIGAATGKPSRHPYPEHMQEARRIAAEGIVLLKNEGAVLPLRGKRVALFGPGATDTVSCGTGSGFVFAPYTVSVEQGLRNAGVTLTSGRWLDRFRKASKLANKRDKTLNLLDRMWSGLRILIDDLPITEEELNEAAVQFVFGLDILIESRDSRLLVRAQPKAADAQGKEAQEEPADEAQEQPEKVELVPFHHRAAAVDGFVRGQFRILFQDKGSHRIGECLDDTGDEEKERPKDDEDVHQEHSPQLVPVFLGAYPIGIAQDIVLAVSQQPEEGIGHADHHRQDVNRGDDIS